MSVDPIAPSRRARRLGGAAVALLLALACTVLGAGPASAHASLSGSDPAQGAVLSTLPETVELRFNEAVATPAYVVVTDADGARVDAGDAEVVDGTVTQPLAGTGAAGRYSVDFRIVSADGHPVSGTVTFEVGPEDGAAPTSTPVAEPDEGFWSGHWQHVALAGAGLLVGVGLLGAGLRGRD